MLILQTKPPGKQTLDWINRLFKKNVGHKQLDHQIRAMGDVCMLSTQPSQELHLSFLKCGHQANSYLFILNNSTQFFARSEGIQQGGLHQ